MDFYPRKAQYLTGEEVWLCLEAADVCEAQRYDRVVLVVYWLEAKIRTVEIDRLQQTTEICAGSYDSFLRDMGYGRCCMGKKSHLYWRRLLTYAGSRNIPCGMGLSAILQKKIW